MTQKLMKLKRKFWIITMINILLLQNLINFAARLAQADLVTKTDFDDKQSNLNRKITSNKTKHLLFENEFKKSKTLIQFIFVVKVILKMMVLKII